MRDLFRITYELLVYLASITGWSYKEINVLIWLAFFRRTDRKKDEAASDSP